MSAPILDTIRAGGHFWILSHRDPDGDALGTALGLAHVIRALGKRADVLIPGAVPRIYEFLSGAGEILHAVPDPPSSLSAVFAVDATSPSRLADLAPALDVGVPVVNIDHHGDNARFGEINWVDPSACATSLMVYDLAREAGFEVNAQAAACLYVGILTDTGRFSFANTDERSLTAAAELASLGANPSELASLIYGRVSPGSLRLLATVLATLDVRDEGRVACLHATERMFEDTGALPEDADGFSTHARNIDGVLVGVFLREGPDGQVKVSFRSNEGVSVDGLAGQFGGGGHPRAAGARVSGPIEKAKEDVLGAVSELLGSRTG